MRCYARLCGKDYLTNMLEPLIRQLNEMDGSVEVHSLTYSACLLWLWLCAHHLLYPR